MRIVSWNVNGLSDRQKARRVILKLQKLKADVIVIQEVYKNNKHLNPIELATKVEEIATTFSYSWNTDLYFDPNGHLAILSAYKHSLKISNSYYQGRIIDFTFSHIP